MEDGLIKITPAYRVGDTRQLQTFDISHLGINQSDIKLRQQNALSFWTLGGGAVDSNVVLIGDTLTVRHSPEINREIAVLIDALLREGRIIRVEHPPHHQRLFETLDRVVDVEFESQTLEWVTAQLEVLTGVPFRLKVWELADEGVKPSSLVAYHLGPRPLRDVLKHMLADVDGSWLTAIVDQGAICITTATAAGDNFEFVLYDVRDLLPYSSPGRLCDLIPEHTTGHWEYEDGPGECDCLPTGYLLVRQESSVHDEIADVLRLLREKLNAPDLPVAVDPESFEVRIYNVSTVVADRLELVLSDLLAPESWLVDSGEQAAWIKRLRIPPQWGHGDFYGGQGGFGGGGQFGTGGGGFFQLPYSLATASQLGFQVGEIYEPSRYGLNRFAVGLGRGV